MPSGTSHALLICAEIGKTEHSLYFSYSFFLRNILNYSFSFSQPPPPPPPPLSPPSSSLAPRCLLLLPIFPAAANAVFSQDWGGLRWYYIHPPRPLPRPRPCIKISGVSVHRVFKNPQVISTYTPPSSSFLLYFRLCVDILCIILISNI